MGRNRLDAATGTEGRDRPGVYTEAWMIEGGPPTGAVRPRVFVVSLAALTTSRFLKQASPTLTVRHSASTLPLCLCLRVIPLVFLPCRAATCVYIAPGCILLSLPALDLRKTKHGQESRPAQHPQCRASRSVVHVPASSSPPLRLLHTSAARAPYTLSAAGSGARMSGQSPPNVMEQDDYFASPRDDTRGSSVQHIEDSDTDMAASATASSSRAAMFSSPTAHSRKPRRISRSGVPHPIITPTSPLTSAIPHNLLPSAPASPPTPAPSPTPTQRVPDWSTAAEYEDSHIKNTRARFGDMNRAERLRLLGELLNLCDSQELSFVAEFVSPRLKKDPFMVLPTELCLRVRSVLCHMACHALR
jgi:hypothetical protein